MKLHTRKKKVFVFSSMGRLNVKIENRKLLDTTG